LTIRPTEADLYWGDYQLEGCLVARCEDHHLRRENSSGTYVYFKDNVLKGDDFSPDDADYAWNCSSRQCRLEGQVWIGYGGAAYAKGIKDVKVKKDASTPGYAPTEEKRKERQLPDFTILVPLHTQSAYRCSEGVCRLDSPARRGSKWSVSVGTSP